MAADPLFELLDALDERGKPALAWIVEHARDGRDPVTDAWTSCRNANILNDFLRRVRHPLAAQAFDASHREYWRVWRSIKNTFEGDVHPGLVAGADAIRRLIPTVTLAELLEARDAG